MAVYPSQQEELLVLKQTDSLVSVTLAEAELIKQEVRWGSMSQHHTLT
jgi:hypothetical protein